MWEKLYTLAIPKLSGMYALFLSFPLSVSSRSGHYQRRRNRAVAFSSFSFFSLLLVDWTKQKESNMSHEFESLLFFSFLFFEGGVKRALDGRGKGSLGTANGRKHGVVLRFFSLAVLSLLLQARLPFWLVFSFFFGCCFLRTCMLSRLQDLSQPRCGRMDRKRAFSGLFSFVPFWTLWLRIGEKGTKRSKGLML